MIKRRFYRLEHGDKDDQSSDSSSSSDNNSISDPEPEHIDQSVDSGEDDSVSDELHYKNNHEVVEEEEEKEPASDSSVIGHWSNSGYESENSSGNEFDDDSSGFVNEDDDDEDGNDRQDAVGHQLSIKSSDKLHQKKVDEDSIADDMPDYVLKLKSVYKCRICPRIICLTEETIRAHLNSKRHARSEKLLKENKLKSILNSDGEIENQETPAERHARIIALAQEKLQKKNKGRQRQRKRLRKQKVGEDSKVGKEKESKKSHIKKKHKSDN